MNSHEIDTNTHTPSQVVYTCWPFGGLLCGVTTIGIGVLLLAEHYLDTAPEVLWGIGLIGLIGLGAAVVLWTHHRNAW